MYLNVFSEQISFRSLALQTAQKFVYFPDFIDLLKQLTTPQSVVYAQAYLNNLQTNSF